MTRWLITGASGMLGRDVVETLRRDLGGEDVSAPSSRELDVRDRAAVEGSVPGHDVVINCAAWTDVDSAELAEGDAAIVNAKGVAHLAAACARTGAVLLQVSTDYVFSGDRDTPWDEDDPPCPVNAYGRTKAAGEKAVLGLLPETGYVVRSSWLYGRTGRSFARAIVEAERAQDAVSVPADQLAQPTSTSLLARALLFLAVSRPPPGVYHVTASGSASRFDQARAIFESLGADPERVRPADSDGGRHTARRAARRPPYSVLGHRRWTEAGLPELPHWRTALDGELPALLEAWDA